MALSKTTSKVLKTGVAVAGTVAAFTPVGGLVGLTGAAAVAADVVGGTVIGAVTDKVGGKLKSEINKHTEKSKDPAKSSASSTASHEPNESKSSKSSRLKKAGTVAATGAGLVGLTKMLGTNKNGRSTSTMLSKFTNDVKNIHNDSAKNYQKDLARAGIIDKGSAAQQASI